MCKFYNVSEFGLKKLQPLRFSIEKFTNRQNLRRNLNSKNHFLNLFSPRKRHNLILCVFKEYDFQTKVLQRLSFGIQTSTSCQILDENFCYVAYFGSRNVSTCKILHQKFFRQSDLVLMMSDNVFQEKSRVILTSRTVTQNENQISESKFVFRIPNSNLSPET